MERSKEEQKTYESGFRAGILFAAGAAAVAFISWAVVFAPMGWWL